MPTRDRGQGAEQYFRELMAQNGFDFQYVDRDYDFIVNKDHKVEVKSCAICVKQPKKYQEKDDERYRYGRFDFTNKDNLKMIRECGWVAFILRHMDQYMLLGIVKGSELEDGKRYVPLSTLRKYNLLSLQQFRERVT